MTELRNSFPLSLMMTVGTPNLQIQRSKKALATVDASLLRSGTRSVYLVNASVITRMSLFPESSSRAATVFLESASATVFSRSC